MPTPVKYASLKQDTHDPNPPHRGPWFRILQWILILSNVPTGVYLSTVIGNLLTYVGQSPEGAFALVHVDAVANQILILRFLPFWMRHRVLGTLIVLQIPVSALGGRWALQSIRQDERAYIRYHDFVQRDQERKAFRQQIESLRQQIEEDIISRILPMLLEEVVRVSSEQRTPDSSMSQDGDSGEDVEGRLQ